jgi:uncharacterized protein with PQ loop repeat
MQFSLLTTAVYDIAMERNSKRMSSIPFIALLTNSTVWTVYGYLTNEIPVLVPNAIGTVSGLICVIIYQLYSFEVIPYSFYFWSFIINPN